MKAAAVARVSSAAHFLGATALMSNQLKALVASSKTLVCILPGLLTGLHSGGLYRPMPVNNAESLYILLALFTGI